MCWTNKTNPEMKIAEENIPVFKIGVKRNWFAPVNSYYYSDTTWKVRKTMPKIKINLLYLNFWNEYCIHEGYHSFKNNVKINYEHGELTVATQWYIFSKRLRKINCIIPKGTVYYINEFGEIVSECLKVKSIEKLEQDFKFLYV